MRWNLHDILFALGLGALFTAAGVVVLIDSLRPGWRARPRGWRWGRGRDAAPMSRAGQMLVGMSFAALGALLVLQATPIQPARRLPGLLVAPMALMFLAGGIDSFARWRRGGYRFVARCPHCGASLDFRLVNGDRCPECLKAL